jgi:hypothetical protein
VAGLKTSLQQEPLRINPQLVSPALTCLKSLYSNTIEGLILVTDHRYADGRVSPSYITILAAPLLGTFGHFSKDDPPGVNYANFWDKSVFDPYKITIPKGLHCPLLAAAEKASLGQFPSRTRSNILATHSLCSFQWERQSQTRCQLPPERSTELFFFRKYPTYRLEWHGQLRLATMISTLAFMA